MTRPWGAWLAAVVGSFAALEWRALARRRNEPLTWFLRRHLGLRPRRWWRWPAMAAFCAGWAWLTAHLLRWVEEVS